MAWSAGAAPGGLLALGCRGGLLLLARPVDGQLVRSIQLKGAVSQMQFCELTAAGNTGDDTTSASGGALLAANVGRRSVCIWQLPAALAGEAAGGGAAAGSSGGAFELAFREGYGELETYCWVHPRLLVAGFSSGQLVAVALGGGLAPGAGTGTERYSARCLQSAVSSLSWCAATGLLAAGGGCQAALLRCQGLEVVPGGEAVSLELDGGARLNNLQLCPPDGKRLTAATSAGRVMQLLARPPLLHGAWGGVVAYVDHSSCASEALLVDLGRSGPAAAGSPVAVPLPAEPDQLALGPGCLAAAQGDQVGRQSGGSGTLGGQLVVTTVFLKEGGLWLSSPTSRTLHCRSGCKAQTPARQPLCCRHRWQGSTLWRLPRSSSTATACCCSATAAACLCSRRPTARVVAVLWQSCGECPADLQFIGFCRSYIALAVAALLRRTISAVSYVARWLL